TGTTRVDWGESLTAISALGRHEGKERRVVRFDLVITDPLGRRQVLETREYPTNDGSAAADFPDLKIVQVSPGVHEAECGMVGRHRLGVERFYEEERVAAASKAIFVHMNPPEPPPDRPVSVEIAVKNRDADRLRINSGEHIDIAVTVKNRVAQEGTF